MSTRDERELRNLAYWAANMVFCKTNNLPTTGFSYSAPEWDRFAQLNERISGRFGPFLFANTVIFIVMAAAAVGGVFIPTMSYLYPDPSKTPSVVFLGGLATTAVVTIGLGLPLSMRLAAACCKPASGLKSETLTDFDRTLSRKVSFQLWRMTLIMCGLLVPGAILLITFNIDAGPLAKWLKLIYGALLVSSTATLYVQNRNKTGPGGGAG